MRETAALRHLHPTWQTVCVFTASHINICGWDLRRKAVMQLWKPMGFDDVTLKGKMLQFKRTARLLIAQYWKFCFIYFFLIGTKQEPAAG